MLGYNRSALKRQSVLGHRGVTEMQVRAESDTHLEFNVVNGEFAFNWALFCGSMPEIETYETAFLSRKLMSNFRTFEVTVPLLGTLNYQVEWGEPDQFDVSKDGAEYSVLTGTAMISGFFVVVESLPNTLLERFIFEIRDWTAETLYYRRDVYILRQMVMFENTNTFYSPTVTAT
jgi:hypothetical protein